MTLAGFTTGGRRCEMDLCSVGAYTLRKERDVDGETGVNIYRGDS